MAHASADNPEPQHDIFGTQDTYDMDLPIHAPPAQPRLTFNASGASQETIRPTATPPISIPIPIESAAISESDETTDAVIDRYMRNREASISFDDEIKLDSGLRQSIQEPLQKTPSREDRRGRSFLTATEQKSYRAHSESERSRYDQITGRHLPQYSSSPPREQARVGEARFPLLQRTVDDMARESQIDLTTSPMEPPSAEVVSPRYDENYGLSPTIASPSDGQAFSYDEPRQFRRTASQRWKDGEFSASPQDFFLEQEVYARACTTLPVEHVKTLRGPPNHRDRRHLPTCAHSRSAVVPMVMGWTRSQERWMLKGKPLATTMF